MKSVNDFRQHYYISKLDRGEVEDKYHRLLESNIELKKKYNSLEEKLKFYFVKFGHLPTNNEKSSLISVNQQNVESEPFLKRQQTRIDELEQINTTLRNDMHVLKDQLAMHSRLHAKSHCHTSWQPARCYCQPESPKKASMKHETFPNSHRTVHQFQSNAKKKKVTSGESQSSQSNISLQEKQQMTEEISKLQDQNVILNQEMEVIRKEKNARIAELEEELSNVVTKDKSQKVAENVEVIRLKLLNQKLAAQQSALGAQTQTLEKTLGDVQEAMNILQSENEQLQQQLVEERQKIPDLLEQVQEVSDLRQTLQEMAEEVQDSKREKSVLKEHNDWLLVLTESAQLRDKDDHERTVEAEKELRAHVTTLEEKLTVELKERAELLELLEETRKQVALLVNSKETEAKVVKQDARSEESKVDGPDHCQGGCSHVQHEVAQLREMLAHELGERAAIVKTLEEERIQVVALRMEHVQLVKQLEQVHTKCNKMESNLEKMASEPVDVNKELGGVNQNLVRGQDVISANPNKNLKPVSQLEATSREANIHSSGNVRTPTLNQTLQVATNGFGYQLAEVLEDHQQSLASEVQDSESSVDTCQVYVPPTEVETSMISGASLDESELLHDLRSSGSMDDKIRALYKTTLSIQNISGVQEELDSQSESYPSLTLQSKGSLIMNQAQTFLRDSAPASRNVKPRDEANAADNVQLADYIDTIRELDKCRELLRVQCNLNGVYKQELSSLKQYYSPREEGEINTSSTEDIQLSIEKDVDLITMKHNSHNTNRLTILDEGQGLFEIHIQYLKLANEALSILGSSNPALFVSWEFYNLSAVYTPLRTGPNAKFEFSSVYLVDINNDFFKYLAEETCVVSVHIANGDEGVQIARGQLQFAPLLEFPHNKLQNSVQLQGLGPDHTNTLFGTLYFWFRLSCSDQLIHKLRKGRHEAGSKVPSSPRDMPIPAPRHPPSTAKEKNAVAEAKSLHDQKSSRKEVTGNSLSNMEDQTILQPSTQVSEGSQKEQVRNKVAELGQKDDLASEQGQNGHSPIKQYPNKIASTNDAKNDGEMTIKSVQRKDGVILLKIPELSNSEDENANTYTVRHDDKDDASSSIDSARLDRDLGDTGLQRAGTSVPKSSELTNSEDEDTNTYTVRQDAGGDISSSNSDVVIGTTKNGEINLLKHSSHSKDNSEDLAKDPHWERHPVAFDEIEIEIHCLKLHEKSSTMTNPDIVQLYVEFAFLGHRGQDMETVSSPKLNSNQLLQYNFKKVFHVDADSHSTERQMLVQMLNSSGSEPLEKSCILHFVVVSEPLEADAEVKDCEEVGFVDVDLLQVLKKGKNLHKVEFPVMSSHSNEVLGSLTLSLTGVQVMKAVAAHSKQPTN